MKTLTRMTLLALLALLIGAAGCGSKDAASDTATDTKTSEGTTKSGAAPSNPTGGERGKEGGTSNPGGFGK